MTNENLRFKLKSLVSTGSPSGVRPRMWLALIVLGTAACLMGLTGLVTVSAKGQDGNQAVPQAAGGQRTDGQIEMDVVHALDAAQQLKDDWITAGTVQGEVTLSGTSATEANRTMAEQIAGQVPGVTKVVNTLKVGNPQSASEAQGQVSDQEQVSTTDAPQQPPAQVEPQAGGNGDAGVGASGNYPAQGGPRPAYRTAPPYPQPYAQQPPPAQMAPEGPRTPVTIAQGTLIKVRTSEALTSKKAKDGEAVEFTVVRDVYAGGVLAIPRGAMVTGKVIDVKKSGALGGSPELALKLDSLNLEGNSYAVDSDRFDVKGPNKAGHTVGNAIGGAIFGAIIGGAVGGGSGAAIGAAAGGAGGTAASAATPGPQVWIPSEALIDFHLNTALTVTPVSRAEAQRLAANAGPQPGQRPTLYRRGYYPYGYPPPPPPGYYARPYPY